MSNAPIVYKTTHRVRFSELDPYNHVNTGQYATYFADHRMAGLRDNVGWDLKTLGELPFMVWVRKLEIEFVRPLRADQELTITSFVRDFHGSDAQIECNMVDASAKTISRCRMTVAYVDKQTNRSADWPLDIAALFFEKSPA